MNEIQIALVNGYNPEIVKKRKNKEVIMTENENGLIIFEEPLPKRYVNIIEEAQLELVTADIKGTVAYVGKVIGTVTIIRSHHDIKKVHEGDILVANTTHPNYLPAMSKASAFVTNEGGMLSHAAIVAREMCKPCIVGTRNATKCLKDGDIVEVDAHEGVVRLVKK